MFHLPHFGYDNNFPLNFKTVTFLQFLVPIIRHKSKKLNEQLFEKSLKMLILGPKMSHLDHFMHSKIFFKKQTPSLLIFYWNLPLR